VMPEVYAEWERNEQGMRDYLHKDISILKDRRGGRARPLTLATLRRRVEKSKPYESDLWGGCGCFIE
jgi:hypothetical protein